MFLELLRSYGLYQSRFFSTPLSLPPPPLPFPLSYTYTQTHTYVKKKIKPNQKQWRSLFGLYFQLMIHHRGE